jgi:uncharacterized protein involved in exopolysaccharide biosynthesis
MANLFGNEVSNPKLIEVLKKNKTLIFFTVISCSILALISTLFMESRYKARASFFVPYNTSLESAIENPQFGFDIEADRLLQLINSNQLKDSVIKEFNLINYYEIDTTVSTWRENLDEKYKNRIHTGRTNIMSIYLEAETHDPKFSAKIVNYILEITQRLRDSFFKTNSLLAVESFKAEYLKKKQEVDSLQVKIERLRNTFKGNSNVYITNNQILSGNSNGTDSQDQLDLEIYTQRFIYGNNKLQALMEKYENAQNVYNRPIPKFYIIDKAVPIYKKVHPLTITYVVIAFLGSLFFITVVLYIKHVDTWSKKSKIS